MARLRLGSKTISPLVHVNTRLSESMENNGAEVEVAASALLGDDIQYLGEAAVEAVLPSGEVHPLFTGVINTVDFSNDVARLTLVGFETELSEIRMGGLVSEGVRAVELIYSLLRLSGIPDERMKLHGWTGSDPDVFLVAVPLEGMAVTSTHGILGAAIGPTNPARLLVPGGELRDRFAAASCWASMPVHAGSLVEAEQRGLDAIDDALSALQGLCAFSYSTLGGDPRPYVRDRTRLRPRRLGVVFTGSITNRRQWLRSISDSADRPTLDVDAEATELAAIDPDERLRRALREWRNAADSETPFARVTHLWRAVELYARGASAGALFNKHEIQAVRNSLAAIEGLSSAQRRRLDDLASHLNDAPLLARLRATLDCDGITVSKVEFDLLKGTRRLRNSLEHAREITPLQDRHLAQALGLVNRVLISALAGRARDGRRVTSPMAGH
ncbi:MAG: hypothetical protein M3R02_21575 [Chloroflexota bacterium]|nr:hypothetical protein [Chloroflexota bacterium]